MEDTRGTLFYEYARLVSEIRPKVFIYENVKAVLSNDEGRTWDTMQNVFTSLGYTWSYQVLNAKDYGIPQNRERVFVVGFRNDLQLAKPFEFPQPIPLEKTMQDFLLDNVSGQYYLPTKGVDFVTSEKNLEKRYTQIDGDIQLCQKKNQQFNWHGDFVFVEEAKAKADLMQDLEKYFLSEKVRKYVLASGTKGFYSRPQTDLPIARPLLTTMHKMHRAGTDNYVSDSFVKNGKKMEVEECLRIKEATKKGYAEAHEGDYVNLQYPNSKTRRGRVGDQIANTLLCNDANAVVVNVPPLRIRKLTPKECFRLMGFDDKDCDILVENKISNTQIYKMAGNSIVVDVLEEIFVELLNQYEDVFPM